MGKEIHHFYYIYPVCDYGRQCRPLLYQVGRFIAFRAVWDIQKRLPHKRLTWRFQIQNAKFPFSVETNEQYLRPPSPRPPHRNPIFAQTLDLKPLYTSPISVSSIFFYTCWKEIYKVISVRLWFIIVRG